jgi:pimeloyl-ACP methyl ester carboxylesterase
VIGHSLGGAATALALARGMQAGSAVLIAPAADPLAAVERFSRLLWLANHLGRRMFARFEGAMRFSADELQAHNNAPRIGRPALIVHDIEDREVPWAEGERWARYWPESRLLSTRGLGHNRIADDDGVIASALRFLRGEAVGDRVVSSPNLPYGLA